MYLRIIMAIVMSLVCVLATPAAEYDPLSVGPSFEAEAMEWTVRDAARDRDVPLRIYLPASRAAEPVVLFSHGLGGNRDGCSYLGHHWAARGYVAVFLQHPGSDDSVWREQAVQNRVAAMREAASTRNYLLRVQDVVAVLDRLAECKSLVRERTFSERQYTNCELGKQRLPNRSLFLVALLLVPRPRRIREPGRSRPRGRGLRITIEPPASSEVGGETGWSLIVGVGGRFSQYRGRAGLCVRWMGLWPGEESTTPPQNGDLSHPISAQAFMCRLLRSRFEPSWLPSSTGYARGSPRHAAW